MNVAWMLLTSVPMFPSEPAVAPAWSQLRHVAQSAQFDARGFEERLGAHDLDERERAFSDVVDAAVHDDAARETLRSWSRDAGRPDLAWTARLALREVERRPGTQLRALKQFGGGAMDDLRGRFDELEQRFGGLDSMFGDLQRDLDRMFSDTPQGAPGAQGRTHVETESFRMQMGPDGVKVEVDEDVNGETKTRTYTAPSVEELLEQHPELKDKVHVGGAFSLRGGQSPHGFAFPPQGPFGGQTPRRLRLPDDDERWSAPAKPLAANGKTRTDILGVLYTKPSEETRERRNLDAGVGIEVERTEPGTIAAALGVQAGDVLVSLNGRPLEDREDVVAALKDRKDGEPVKLELVDAKGRRHTLTWNES